MMILPTEHTEDTEGKLENFRVFSVFRGQPA